MTFDGRRPYLKRKTAYREISRLCSAIYCAVAVIFKFVVARRRFDYCPRGAILCVHQPKFMEVQHYPILCCVLLIILFIYSYIYVVKDVKSFSLKDWMQHDAIDF